MGGVLEKKFLYRLLNSDGTEITLDELIDNHYNNPEECFVKGYSESKEVDDSNCNNCNNYEEKSSK
jgi:hypothetical protein